VVNFARLMKQPIFVSFGYNDLVVCPTSIQAACNAIEAPIHLMIVPQSRHYTYPEQMKARSAWMMENVVK
jgi:cephalosporin-C deacetylase-like acetyl esterase